MCGLAGLRNALFCPVPSRSADDHIPSRHDFHFIVPSRPGTAAGRDSSRVLRSSGIYYTESQMNKRSCVKIFTFRAIEILSIPFSSTIDYIIFL